MSNVRASPRLNCGILAQAVVSQSLRSPRLRNLKFDDLLDDFVYRKIWQGLSEQDRKVILAISDSKTKVTDFAKICRSCEFLRGRVRGVLVSGTVI